MNASQKLVTGLFEQADIQIGGSRPQDIHVHSPEFYNRLIADGSLGLGESYMDGQWTAPHINIFMEKLLRGNLQEHVRWNHHIIFAGVRARLLNMQTKARAKRVAREHYDLSYILPSPLLDPYNQYTCAYFRDTDALDEAQEKKLDLICRKLQLSEKDRVLDVGCGWGGFAKYAAEHYGCHVTGISISREQIKYASEFCRDLPVSIQYCDYRDLEGEYDKVLTCGMIEHVGYKNYRTLFEKIHAHMAPGGLYLLHTIGRNISATFADPFLNKYIFPGGMIPSLEQLDRARERLFTLQDMQNLGMHYIPTLLAWYDNLQKHWSALSKHYSERFRRMFEYYLLSCAGGFQAGNVQLWQLVFTKMGHVIDYQAPR